MRKPAWLYWNRRKALTVVGVIGLLAGVMFLDPLNLDAQGIDGTLAEVCHVIDQDPGYVCHEEAPPSTVSTTPPSSVPNTSVEATTTSPPSSAPTTQPSTTTTVAPSTTAPSTSSSTTVAPMPPMHEACPGIPDVTPLAALPPALPMICDHLATGVAATLTQGANTWIDEFNHHASMATLGDGYLAFERASLSGTGRTGTFRHNEHWMQDVYAPGQTGGTMIRPDRSFRFEDGKLVVEAVIATPIDDYEGFAWPEITVTTASSPASSSLGMVGPTPGTSIGDDLYAYGQFGGQWSVGIRLTGSRPIAALYDTTHRGFPCGRVWEISWFQDGFSPGTGECPKARQFSTFGGGEWAVPSGTIKECHGTDPDTTCRNLWRWELTQQKITLYVNGRKLMEHTALPGFVALPDEMVNAPVYVYFSGWAYKDIPNRVARFHWDRLAVNP